MAGEIGERIGLARKSCIPPYRQADFAKKIRIDRARLSNWERGFSDPNDEDILITIASELDVNLKWLATGEGDMRCAKSNATFVNESSAIYGFSGSVAVPLWHGALAAENFDGDCFFERDGYIEIGAFFATGTDISLISATRITGSSMHPRAPSGSLVIFRTSTTQIPNAITLFRSPNGEVIIKVFRQFPPVAESINRETGADFPLGDGWEILGHAIGIQVDPDVPGPNIEFRFGSVLKG